jgi:hypothetical protein
MAIVLPACVNALGAEIIPAPARVKTDHPRLLVRTNPTSYAVSLSELRAAPKDKDYDAVLAQLRRQDSASAQAMVWLLTGDAAAADKAIARLRAYRFPGEVDTFHIYLTLTEFGLAYDWLYNYEGFTPALKAEARANAMPLAQFGLRQTNDHMFHNYIWMSAGGVAMWAMAIAGEDEPSNRLFEQIRARFNEGLFPAWKYLDGLPSEPMGYWALYVFSPGVLTILAAQSAFETNAVGLIRDSDGNWLDRHFENLIHSTLPDMRYIPWGDLQSGPNGGVTREMAGIIDALTWATHSAHGAYFSDWIAKKRGLGRFEGDTAIFYLLYSRRLGAKPQLPPLSFFAGAPHGGHFIARSGWGDGDTVVSFRCTDHFGDHHHYDQGSFVIYRNGLLAVDPPVYSKVRGPQQPTDVHNTLLLGGQLQRPVRGQWFKTVEEFQKNLTGGRMLETGDVLFHKDGGDWAAVAGQFAQAYPPELAQSCVRQMLFVRPGAVVIVDQLVAPAGKELPEVQWLLQTPAPPTVDGTTVWTTNGKSWLRCRALSADASPPTVEPTAVKTHRVSYRYKATGPLVIAHVLDVGDGTTPGKPIEAEAARRGESLECSLAGRVFVFSTRAPYEVAEKGK